MSIFNNPKKYCDLLIWCLCCIIPFEISINILASKTVDEDDRRQILVVLDQNELIAHKEVTASTSHSPSTSGTSSSLQSTLDRYLTGSYC